MPSRTRSWRRRGAGARRAELARCRTSGSSPASSASASASSKAADCAALAGWSGSSEQARCDQSPVTRTLPVLLGGARGRDQRQPLLARGAAAGQAGVDLELHAARAARPAGPRDDLLELGDRRGRDVDVRLDERREVGARAPPASTAAGPVSPAARRASASSPRGHAEPLRAGRAGRPGHRHHAVAVAVGLDHRPSAADPEPPSATSSRSRRTLCRIAPRSTTTSACGLGGGRHASDHRPIQRRAGPARPPAPRRPRSLAVNGPPPPARRRRHRAATTRPTPRPTGPARPPAASR